MWGTKLDIALLAYFIVFVKVKKMTCKITVKFDVIKRFIHGSKTSLIFANSLAIIVMVSSQCRQLKTDLGH